jgi:hypothetical protein
MKKRLFALALAAAMLLAFIPVWAQAQPFEAVTGWEMMERLGPGLNFGNVFEAPAYGNPMNEMGWGSAPIEEWHMDAIVQMGFTHVRIPVRWDERMDANNIILPEFMARIQQVVDWALARDLYVIINTHHVRALYDPLFYGPFSQAETWLHDTWRQVATRFRDYDHRLVFELMNEPRPGLDGWFHSQAYYVGNFSQRVLDFAVDVNSLNATTLELIRGTGGNNAQRVVMTAAIQGGGHFLPLHEQPDCEFTMMGVFLYPYGYTRYIESLLNAGIPVYVKEFAPIFEHANWDTMYVPLSQGRPWVETYAAALTQLGVPIGWWNTATLQGWQLWCRGTNEWAMPLVQAFFTGIGRTAGTPMETQPPAFPYELSTEFTNDMFTNWLPSARPLAYAELLVVEHTGITGHAFVRHYPAPWAQFDEGDARITVEPGRLIFDLTGLTGSQLALGVWAHAEHPRLTRAFLTTRAQLDAQPATQPAADPAVVAAASNWAQLYVTTALENNLIPAALQSNFTRATTRQEFAQLAVVLYESIRGEIQGRETFTDTSNTYVQKAAYIGVVSGMGDGTFNPQGQLTRAQAAAMMSRLATAMGAPLPQHTPTFGDTNDFPIWAADYIGQMQASGIMGGLPDGTFAPQDPYTREASITTIVRLLRRLI